MQLMQMYDRNGVAGLEGGSKFKHHIDWLPLFSPQFGTPRSGGDPSGRNWIYRHPEQQSCCSGVLLERIHWRG